MEHLISEIAQRHLIDLGLVSSPDAGGDWPCYIDSLPDEPDNAIAAISVSGVLLGKDILIGDIFEYHGLQLLARSNSPVDGFVKLSNIMSVLTKITNALVQLQEHNGTATITYRIQNYSPKTPVAKLGPEQTSHRFLFSSNYDVTVLLV
ncbi:MAG: hypothetical protein KatS3mg087_1188 [Patescibacteria group bacterium]|nr:MAG: hypothetical protein KatS3mg087_1188 [Patescibacteria group bacterium]